MLRSEDFPIETFFVLVGTNLCFYIKVVYPRPRFRLSRSGGEGPKQDFGQLNLISRGDLFGFRDTGQ